MKRSFIIEIGTEELPAGVILPALSYIKEKFSEILKREDIQTFGTPRRLVFYIKEFEDKKERIEETIYGPPWNVAFDKEGNPTKALEGFLRKYGFSKEQVFKAKREKGEYVAVRVVKEEKTLLEKLKENFERILLEVPFPKRMRWTSFKALTFSRPVRWILALYGNEVIDLHFGNVRAGRYTYGHRILSPERIEINEAEEYFEKVRRANVIVSFEERRDLIEKQIKEIAEKFNGEPEYPEGLLEEVANLVEYPYPVSGEFEEKFLELPEKVIVTVLAHHQRFFCIRRGEKLINKFIGISNNKPNEKIKKGYEKVIRARLEDALFFYKEDLKKKLEDLVPKLSGVLVHPKVGTVLEKVERMKKVSEKLCDILNVSQDIREKVKRAVFLSKADLLTEMVKEFDELQGYMGYIYALKQGEDEEVARAIYEQYKPKTLEDEIPETLTGSILSLTDRIDNLFSFFSAGEIPKGSSDPFGLRRSAFGIIKIVDLMGWDIDLNEFKEFYKEFDIKLLKDFMAQRLETYLEGNGTDIIRAVLEVEDPLKPYSVIVKVRAIAEIKDTPMLNDIYEAYRRVVRIIPRNWERDEVREELIIEDQEAWLWERIKELEMVEITLEDLAGLRKYIDELFDNVMIMDDREEIRNNRLALLLKTKKLFNRFADFSKLSLS